MLVKKSMLVKNFLYVGEAVCWWRQKIICMLVKYVSENFSVCWWKICSWKGPDPDQKWSFSKRSFCWKFTIIQLNVYDQKDSFNSHHKPKIIRSSTQSITLWFLWIWGQPSSKGLKKFKEVSVQNYGWGYYNDFGWRFEFYRSTLRFKYMFNYCASTLKLNFEMGSQAPYCLKVYFAMIV